MALVATSAPATAKPPGRLLAPSAVGTVDTVAGPGFCPGPATPDPTADAVGGLAADAAGAGSLWYEIGEVAEGRVTRIFSTTSVRVQSTGVMPAGRKGQHGPRARPASAGRLAADGSGGLLIAKPAAVLLLGDGLVTLAGTTSPATAAVAPGAGLGDGGPLRAARFNHIAAIAADPAGNVYVADEVDRRANTIAIRFLNRSAEPVTFYPGTPSQLTVAPGTIGTLAGGPARGDAPLGPLSRLVALAPALAVAEGRLYLGATGAGQRSGAVVRLLNLGAGELSAHGATVRPGEMTTVATVEGAPGATRDLAGRPPPGAVPGIAVDAEGDLFLADPAGHRVRRVDGSGVVTTFAGTGAAGFNGNDRAAATARLDRPYDVEIGPDGRLYISDAGNGLVRFVDRGGTIRAALGNGAGIRWNCRGSGDRGATPAGRRLAGQNGGPGSMAADGSGNAYIALNGLGQVHRLAPSGRLQPVAGRPRAMPCPDSSGCAGEGAPATATDFAALGGVALGPGGGIYVQDGSRVRFVNLGRRPVRLHGVVVAPGTVRTVAGRTRPAGPGTGAFISPAGDGGPALKADIAPGSLVADRRGNLLLGDPARGSVRQVDPRGTITTPLSPPPPGEDGKINLSRCCSFLAGLALDRAGNLYIADGSRAWFLNRSGAAVVVHGVAVAAGAVEAVAGSAGPGSQDEGGRAIEVSLPGLGSVAVDRSGNLYVLTGPDHTVRRVDRAGAIATVAGSGQRGFNGDGLKGVLTALDGPGHVVVDACGNLLIAEVGNDRVRRLNVVASCAVPDPGNTAAAAQRSSLALVAGAAAALAAVVFLAVRRGRRRRAPGSGAQAGGS